MKYELKFIKLIMFRLSLKAIGSAIALIAFPEGLC
jgi:hypothetical protein